MRSSDYLPLLNGIERHPLMRGFKDGYERVETALRTTAIPSAVDVAPIVIVPRIGLAASGSDMTHSLDICCVIGTSGLIGKPHVRISRKMVRRTHDLSCDDSQRLNLILQEAERSDLVNSIYERHHSPLTLLALLELTTAPDPEDTVFRATYPLLSVGETAMPPQWALDNAIYQKTGAFGLWKPSSREEWLRK